MYEGYGFSNRENAVWPGLKACEFMGKSWENNMKKNIPYQEYCFFLIEIISLFIFNFLNSYFEHL